LTQLDACDGIYFVSIVQNFPALTEFVGADEVGGVTEGLIGAFGAA